MIAPLFSNLPKAPGREGGLSEPSPACGHLLQLLGPDELRGEATQKHILWLSPPRCSGLAGLDALFLSLPRRTCLLVLGCQLCPAYRPAPTGAAGREGRRLGGFSQPHVSPCPPGAARRTSQPSTMSVSMWKATITGPRQHRGKMP